MKKKFEGQVTPVLNLDPENGIEVTEGDKLLTFTKRDGEIYVKEMAFTGSGGGFPYMTIRIATPAGISDLKKLAQAKREKPFKSFMFDLNNRKKG